MGLGRAAGFRVAAVDLLYCHAVPVRPGTAPKVPDLGQLEKRGHVPFNGAALPQERVRNWYLPPIIDGRGLVSWYVSPFFAVVMKSAEVDRPF